jgi:hypothetical protein
MWRIWLDAPWNVPYACSETCLEQNQYKRSRPHIRHFRRDREISHSTMVRNFRLQNESNLCPTCGEWRDASNDVRFEGIWCTNEGVGSKNLVLGVPTPEMTYLGQTTVAPAQDVVSSSSLRHRDDKSLGIPNIPDTWVFADNDFLDLECSRSEWANLSPTRS